MSEAVNKAGYRHQITSTKWAPTSHKGTHPSCQHSSVRELLMCCPAHAAQAGSRPATAHTSVQPRGTYTPRAEPSTVPSSPTRTPLSAGAQEVCPPPLPSSRCQKQPQKSSCMQGLQTLQCYGWRYFMPPLSKDHLQERCKNLLMQKAAWLLFLFKIFKGMERF